MAAVQRRMIMIMIFIMIIIVISIIIADVKKGSMAAVERRMGAAGEGSLFGQHIITVIITLIITVIITLIIIVIITIIIIIVITVIISHHEHLQHRNRYLLL